MTMTEHDPILEQSRGCTAAQRDYAVTGIELRAVGSDSNLVDFYGHASVTGRAYDMYGGVEAGGFTETIVAGAFKKTLREKPDVAFLVNHAGLTLARTKAGTLQLAEDSVGLEVRAQLDRRVSIVNDITVLMEQGNLDEMSFAFRVVKQAWLNEDGAEVPWWDMAGIDRQIREVSLQKGDVSVVNYGANPYTDAALRSLPDEQLLDLLAGRPELVARAAAMNIPAPPEVQPGMHPDVAERYWNAIRTSRGL
jgi:HK97 family phage prohead protease